MRLLHVGSGFRPLRRGGLVAYSEDLMAEQVRRGHEVSYFFSGRYYPLLKRPRLRRWPHLDGVSMLEVVNSPLDQHGRQPEMEIAEPRVERMFAELLEEIRPDAVHVHELAGLPSSLLDMIRHSGAPSVVTLQDYFPLCSTFKLLDVQGRVCTRLEIGEDCAANTAAAEAPEPGLMFEATVGFHLRHLPLLKDFAPVRREPHVRRVAEAVGRAEAARRRRARGPVPSPPAAFQRRREANVERLNRADCVIAMSSRVAELYAERGVDPNRMRTIHLTLAHIEKLRPRRMEGGRPLTFATLAGFESEAKGARLLLETARLLSGQAAAGRFRLLVFGHVDPRFKEEAERAPGVEVRGFYHPIRLDSMLDEVDVGLMPSVWEEAYGYAGVEFLAKAIPVVANAIGGMPDYTREGQTGWLNRSCSAEELARIMAGLIERPEEVAALNERLIASRDDVVKPVARHADEMDAVYREVIEARANTVVY